MAHQNLGIAKRSPLFFLKRDRYLYLLLLLPLAHVLIFRYFPMYGVTIAFKDYNIFTGIWDSQWVGMQNFQDIFQSREFFQALRNTFWLNFLDLVIGFPVPIILAIFINEIGRKFLTRSIQTVIYLPHFLSWVIIGGIVFQVLGPDTGIVNHILKSLGVQQIPFLNQESTWVGTYVGVGVWQSAGWGTIIYLAAIAGINPELYEAASIDGASRFQRIRHITLPGMKPTIVILLILNIGRIASIGFDRPFILGNPIVADWSDVISTYVYRIGLQSMQFSPATAVGLFQSVVGLVFLVSSDIIARKNGERGIW